MNLILCCGEFFFLLLFCIFFGLALIGNKKFPMGYFPVIDLFLLGSKGFMDAGLVYQGMVDLWLS